MAAAKKTIGSVSFSGLVYVCRECGELADKCQCKKDGRELRAVDAAQFAERQPIKGEPIDTAAEG